MRTVATLLVLLGAASAQKTAGDYHLSKNGLTIGESFYRYLPAKVLLLICVYELTVRTYYV